MEILGIGMPELVFIIIIVLIVLGPKDMQNAGKTIGKWLRDLVTSDGWKIFQQTSRELRTLPNKLMREANEELNQIGRGLKDASDPELERSAYAKGPARSQPYSANPSPAKTPSETDSETKQASQTESDNGRQNDA